MLYDHNSVEQKWQAYWRENGTYRAVNGSTNPKYYVLDMFPYPSGAGLHVGHPLGYIASDIVARYKRHLGYNVLHPMGYDSFGLPAEQYAIQTGQHPAVTTKNNIARYREQLDRIGFSFDWDREVRTSDPEYYKWTQWIFIQLFESWYDNDADKAVGIEELESRFRESGNSSINAACDEETPSFTASEWNAMERQQQERILLSYRLTYLKDTEVNWCPALGTVLANDEIVNGVSERGGHPVTRKKMLQWVMRISAYAPRLLDDLETIDWSDSIKETQRNWIGRSTGAIVQFAIDNEQLAKDGKPATIKVFTTRPDTIFGVTFMTLAPELDLVQQITTDEQRPAVEAYIKATAARSERDRMSDVKTITGVFTGAYALHPFTNEQVPIWIGDYVLAGYGTGAVMAVPCGDERDHAFANHFAGEQGMPAIKNIFAGVDITEAAHAGKDDTPLQHSDFLNGMSYAQSLPASIKALEERGAGTGKTNYRLRDAVFSRQRYWGEPFPVYYKHGMPQMIDAAHLPVQLPQVDEYLPTQTGEPPLGRADRWSWCTQENKVVSNDDDRNCVFPLELNTMPGWAGSSWYFFRYMDPSNPDRIASQEAMEYWNNVDLYIGGSEHATGHLLYSRFWVKFLHDRGIVGVKEPFQKLINQGMILGESAFAKGLAVDVVYDVIAKDTKTKSTMSRGTTKTTVTVLGATLNEAGEVTNLHGERISKSLFEEDILDQATTRIAFQLDDNNTHQDSHSLSIKNAHLTSYRALSDIRVPVEAVDYSTKLVKTAVLTSIDAFATYYVFDNREVPVDHFEVEKMSKSKYNVVNPDDICEQYGADTLRLYEMFLGPLEQAKPWSTAGITGVYGFLKKLWKLYHDGDTFSVSDAPASKDNLKSLHKTIKKVRDDIENFSFNTSVSSFMICVNELGAQKCNNREVLEPLAILVSPYIPHMAEELWSLLGHTRSISREPFPVFEEKHVTESSKEYPISFNGKMKFKLELPLDMSKEEIERTVLTHEKTQEVLQGREPKKVIVVPGKIVNVVG